MTIDEYIRTVNKQYKAGISTEHSYRGDLKLLLETLLPRIQVTNEPVREAFGAPDYILTRNRVPVGYIEAKDIGEPLDGKKKHKQQFEKYKAYLPNLIITDYLNFRLYVDGEFVTSIKLAEIDGSKIVPLTENYGRFRNLISDFGERSRQTIRSPRKLAELMAGKARILADVLEIALTSDEKTEANSNLKQQMNAFRNILIHDIDPKQFADIYSQTVAYGMFAARLHDPNLDTFTRQEAAVLIPKTNPFLRKLFQDIAGYELDSRIVWIVDGLADLFRATNVASILKNFGKTTQTQDPIIHFYETFLAEYDPKLRKSRGVWYTPEPVVNFIVRAVDDILKSEFGLNDGLADNSKTTVKVNTDVPDKRSPTGYKQKKHEVHKVQILDPATGTGTFLAEVIKQVYNKFEGQKGIWSNYVEDHLIPRLNGFELLMASYAMAHLKLDMLLTETGYNPTRDQRLRVFLTNSLEEHHPETGTLFSSWLSNEASEANHIKRDTPVMCVIGNPPYSGESKNKGEWILSLLEDYKKEPGGKEKLKERNPKWINADENKFIRYGQHFIEKNNSGILAFINPHSFLDNPTFRGMRWQLLSAFDIIHIIDLHGNIKKKERSPDGSVDTNVFDIEQGVSINIFVKNGNKKSNALGKVYHYDLFGTRDMKYKYLRNNTLKSTPFKTVNAVSPHYFFVPKDLTGLSTYNKGFRINSLFPVHSLGIQTHRDRFIIDINKEGLSKRIINLLDESIGIQEIKDEYNIKESKDFNIIKIRKNKYEDDKLVEIDYRPFDTRYIYYDKNMIDRERIRVMKHLLQCNFSLIISKHLSTYDFQHIFVSRHISESCLISIQTKEQGYCFPLYLYPKEQEQLTIKSTLDKKPNLDAGIINKIEHDLSLIFTPIKKDTENTFAPIDIMDYIYSVLHSPNYREKYKEFLKIDFPRVPYPKDQKTFWELVKLGGELRQIHLLEHPTVNNFITTYPEDGSNVITKRITKTDPGFVITDQENELGKVWINDKQYFDNVPLIAWEFYIGGYQPAQKWLKDRKDRQLCFDEIRHYQKIIVALVETERIMREVDGIFEE